MREIVHVNFAEDTDFMVVRTNYNHLVEREATKNRLFCEAK